MSKAAETQYQKAAEKSDASAQFNLGGVYVEGQCVLKDYLIAYIWFNLAAAQRRSVAAHIRDFLADNLTYQKISEAQALTREWAAKNGK